MNTSRGLFRNTWSPFYSDWSTRFGCNAVVAAAPTVKYLVMFAGSALLATNSQPPRMNDFVIAFSLKPPVASLYKIIK